MLVLAPATAHPAAPKSRPGVVSHWEINNIQQDHLPIHIALGCYGSNLVHPKMNQNLVHPESWPVHLWALKRSSALSSARSRKAMARSASAVPSAITGENEIGIGSVGQLCPKFGITQVWILINFAHPSRGASSFWRISRRAGFDAIGSEPATFRLLLSDSLPGFSAAGTNQSFPPHMGP